MKLYFLYRVIYSRFFPVLSARWVVPVVVAFSFIILCSSSSSARLTGDASLTYSKYDGSVDAVDANGRVIGRNSMSSHSLVQNYSLLYSSQGTLYNSRVGRYDVALGYNWTALDTAINTSYGPSESYTPNRGHLLYKGEIILDPKEVPIKLHAYSRDMTSNTVTYVSGLGMKNFVSTFGYNPEPTNINDGIHLETGATLVAGVKNGMTNGYNETLRHFPMILVDYRNTINRDLRSINPIDDQLSRLAFVSLNKKDNWFHYRYTIYEDKLNFKNNYIENEVQLGTVDQSMSRRWIDFTNWLKVSTDILYSRRKSNYQDNPIEEINFNFFLAGERSKWSARTFTTFNRYKDEFNKLSYQTTLPVYAAGTVNQDLSWNARTSIRDNHDLDAMGIQTNFTSLLAGYRIDAYKRSPFTLSQSFDIETSKTSSSDYLTLNGVIESSSTPRFSRNVSLAASYRIKSDVSSADLVSSSSFLEQGLELQGAYAPTNTHRFEIHQSIVLTKGSQTIFNGTTRNSQALLSQYYNPRSQLSADIGSSSIHSVSKASVLWSPKPRLSAHITLSEDVYNSSVLGVNPVTEIFSGVSYATDAWTLSDTVKLSRGSRESFDENANSISTETRIRYIHSRKLDASANATYTASEASGSKYHDTSVEQHLNYHFFSSSGISRKLFEINETLLYTDGTSSSNQAFTKSLMLGFKYYPIRQLTLASGVGYSYTTSISDYTIVWNASASANFRLLQASIEYISGIRRIDNVRENRLTGTVRRSF